MKMKLFIASDIHGSEYYCRKMLDKFESGQYDKLILLGDILYHGPRNALPGRYNPKGVIEMLNNISDKILCVRGNCDTEVDQMVLDFPIMAEYAYVFADGTYMFLTHGHSIPCTAKQRGNIVISGHTHVPKCEENAEFVHLNPGSVSIPKENSPHSFLTFDKGVFEWHDIESGEIYKRYEIIYEN